MSQEIANTIWKQLLAGGQIKVMCWGIPLNTRVIVTEPNGDSGLLFKVNGMKFKGFVKIVYNRSPDLYTVSFLNVEKKKNWAGGFDKKYVVEKEIEGVFCDELTTNIDEYVEKIPAYKY